MNVRQIVLDTETTGLHVEKGHRIIEIGAVELINRKITGQKFHVYINPLREIDREAIEVHGISNAFLQDKPTFDVVLPDLIKFIQGAELIIHNAPFDLAFLNQELKLHGTQQTIKEYISNVTDTLYLARQMHVGQKNSLDALCKRYDIDLSQRQLHGALLDATLLTHVYLAMTGGQEDFFGLLEPSQSSFLSVTPIATMANTLANMKLPVLFADKAELEAHADYMHMLNTLSSFS